MNHPPPLQADNSTNKNKNKEKSPSICSAKQNKKNNNNSNNAPPTKKRKTNENPYKQKLLGSEINWKKKFHQERKKCIDLQQKLDKLALVLQNMNVDHEDDEIEAWEARATKMFENTNDNMDMNMDLFEKNRDKLKLDIEEAEEEERGVMEEIDQLFKVKENMRNWRKNGFKLSN
eukprot:UN06066